MESSSSVVTPTPMEKTLTLWPGTYRSPVTDALWHVRSNFVRRVRNVSPPLNGPAAAQSRLLQHRTPEQSRTSVMYGFSSDAVLREQYRDPWNSIRIGMLLEDLDSLAGSIALKTRKATQVNPLIPQTEEEKHLYALGEAHAAEQKKQRMLQQQNSSYIPGVDNERLNKLLTEGRVLSEMPALADRNSILIRETRLENTIICHPQQQNLHGQIFGGFLMQRAFELAFSTCYVFGGIRPLFLEVDHVDFLRPVDVGDLLRFKACVLYTETENVEQPLIHIEVVAHVTQPENRSSEVSNTFYFTFTLDPEYLKVHKEHPVRKVLPATEEEACNYLARYDADHLSIHPYIRY
ncbi:hypothetical protein CY35_04G128100 [Sphagnum magellanicum]|nr:hypothetical protein CY35_04G128100 [Sphagnum magellanicum]